MPDSAFYRYKRMLSYIVQQWRGLVIILTLTLVTAATAALMPWPLKILVDYAIGNAAPPVYLEKLLHGLSMQASPGLLIVLAGAASLGLFVLSTALSTSLTWMWSSSGQRMVYGLASDLFARLQRLSLRFHNEHSVGDALNRLSTDTWCVHKLAADVLIAPSQHVFTIASISILAWTLDPGLTLLMLAITPILAGSALYFGKRLKQKSRQQREAQSRLTSFVHQTLSAIPIVHSFATAQRNRSHFLSLAEVSVHRAQQNVFFKHAYSYSNGLTIALGTALVLYTGGQRVLADTISIGSLLVFIAYMKQLKGSFSGLLGTYGSIKSNEASIDRVLDILDSEDLVKNAANARPLPATISGQGMSVHLDNVTFGYEPGRAVLENVTLNARAGETIALVGATGAGKSTLVSLIPRFYDPCQGRILINGIDIREVQVDSLRGQIAMVLQEPFLFPLSIADNIAYGRPQASHPEILAAAIAANADEFIQKLPEGYDTVIGERGATLSGGQRQRLSIARALLKDAPILILDEPTSALDTKTETLLVEAIERLMARRTTFIVAHRLSTIRNADRIVVLENKQIIECGTHQELLDAQGNYHRYHSLQTAQTAEINP